MHMNMKNRLSAGGMALVGALLLLLVTALPASAHEVRQVGPYTLVVGFLNEPAYAGQQNSLDLTICNGKQCQYTVQDGLRVVANPVTNAEQTLKAQVIMGSAAPLSLPLEPRYANPGKYASYFVPSKVGSYTFHIVGTLNGMKIDEQFTSSPNTFEDTEQIHVYPPVASQAPDTSASQAQVQAAQHSANTAMTLGIVGIIVGVLGLATAGLALARKPRLSTQGQPAGKSPVESLRG